MILPVPWRKTMESGGATLSAREVNLEIKVSVSGEHLDSVPKLSLTTEVAPAVFAEHKA